VGFYFGVKMPYDPSRKRDYKKEYKQDLKTGKSGPGSDQHERQKARRMYDSMGIDRDGKHIDHKKPIRSGGKSVKGNLRLRDPSKNSADNGK
jgi:hypothetical protein